MNIVVVATVVLWVVGVMLAVMAAFLLWLWSGILMLHLSGQVPKGFYKGLREYERRHGRH